MRRAAKAAVEFLEPRRLLAADPGNTLDTAANLGLLNGTITKQLWS